MIALWIQARWQTRGLFAILMLPLAWLYCLVMKLRRQAYASGLRKSHRVACPVIIVGNLSVGGTGKTPLVIWLVEKLVHAGYRPGIISRGYGGSAGERALLVTPGTPVDIAGDEPTLLSRKTGRPVAICPDRVAAAELLLSETDCDVVIADDGLQHLRLQRDIEVAVISSDRIAGNGWCLPAGPLRESPSTLNKVDIVITRAKRSVYTDWHLQLEPAGCRRVDGGDEVRELAGFKGSSVHAVAGIGNPDSFFASLREAGMDVIEHAFPDHHPYTIADLSFSDERPVIMTEKDAVKCTGFARPDWWALTVSASVDEGILDKILMTLEETVSGG